MRRDRRRRDLVKCEDMRLFAQRAIRYVGEKNVAEFEADEILQAAVFRAVSTVGEAARRVSLETQAAAPEIPWSDIIGMRHVLVHDYVNIDARRVYEVVECDLPPLLQQLTLLVSRLEKEVGWDERK